MSEDKTITVTLVRGKSYSHFFNGEYHAFERAVPKEVTDEGLARELEGLTEEINTDDGDVIEKDIFKIDWEASKRAVANKPKKLRMRIVTEEVDEEQVRKAPPPRKAPVGFKRR